MMSVIINGNNSRILQPYDRRHASGSVGEIPLHADSSEHEPRIHHALEYFVIIFYWSIQNTVLIYLPIWRTNYKNVS